VFEDSADGERKCVVNIDVRETMGQHSSWHSPPWLEVHNNDPCTALCALWGLAHAEGEGEVPGEDDLQLTAVPLSLPAMSVGIALGLPEPPLQLKDRRPDFRSLGLNTVE
jgi:hypothetical protein